MKAKCLICKKKYQSVKGLILHVRNTHNVTSQDYYDRFIKQEGEGLCKECDGPTSYMNFTKGYRAFCSCRCRGLNKEVQKKASETCLKHYGVEYASQSEEIKEKKKQTCFQHYGVEHPFQSEEVRKRAELTCIDKYGLNPLQSESIRKKKRETCLNKYGVENPSQSEEIKEKKKQTCFHHYGVGHPSQSEEVKRKIEQTCLSRYGVENVFQLEEVQEKIVQGHLEKYGVKYMTQTKLFKDKTKQTWLNRCGVEYATQTKDVRDKIKQTCLKKYGVENPFQSKVIRDKHTQVLLRNYGVSNAYALAEITNVSKPEREIQVFLDQHSISFSSNDRTVILNPNTNCYLELDLWFPDLMKAIEYNGAYWHSLPDMNKRDKVKVNQCLKLGIDLMIIEEGHYLKNKNKVYWEILEFLTDPD